MKQIKTGALALLTTGALTAALAGCGPASASTSSTPSASTVSTIKIGTLYAGSGSFATSSLPEYHGLQFWANQVNQHGGVYVKSLHKKVKVKIVSYNDQSSPTTATSLYNQLITVNHVNLLVADFGSVLTSVAVPLAQEHHMVLFDQTGTGTTFFTPSNHDIVLTDLPTSGLWPDSLATYLIQHHFKKVAIAYDTNDFDQSQNNTLVSKLKAAGITPVYDQGLSTSTSNYSVPLHNIAATHPQAVVELGYPPNDIAFLQALKSSGSTFPFVFTIFPGQLPQLFQSNVGLSALNNLYTYPAPPIIKRPNVNYGLKLSAFKTAYAKTGHTVNFLSIAGYNTGLIMQKVLATSTSLKQSSLRQAAGQISGTLTTLDGKFTINSEGAQIGETLPVGQFHVTNGKLKMSVLSPLK